jgi:tetratricopeptide (TPR) repeat protein
MYLKGSQWSMNRRRKPVNIGRIFVLVVLVAGAFYVNQVIVPTIPPPFVATATPTRAPESYVTEADKLVEEGKYNQAIQSYLQAVQSDPKNPANYISLARLQIFTGNYTEAVTNAENALLLNGNNSMAFALRGWALGFTGDFLEAEAALKNATEIDPNNAVAYAYLAEVRALQTQAGQGSLGSLDKAVEASRTAQNLAPNIMETHRARGIVLELTGNYPEAAQEFESAIAINGNIADLHLALGRNYRYQQIYDKAVEEFNRANALNPGDPLPNTYISRTYATVGEFAKAIQFAQQAVKVSPKDPFLYGNLGVMYKQNLQYKDAIGALRLVVRGGLNADGERVEALPLDYGRIAEYYSSYGLSLAHVGECGEALQVSQQIQQIVQNDEDSVFNAEEMVRICQEAGSATRTPAGTEGAAGVGTETATETAPTDTPAPTASATPAP